MMALMMSLVMSIAGNLVFWIFASGALLIWWNRRRGRAGWWTIAYLGLVWLVCTRPIAETLLRPLEGRFEQPSLEELQSLGVSRVVVLTGGGFRTSRDTLSSSLPHASIYRFLGGTELCDRLGPDCRLVFSGSAGRGNRGVRTADTMLLLARALAPQVKASAESISGSTGEHPTNLERFLDGRPFALVTSANHLPRAVRSFRRHGLEPVPYPVDFLVLGEYSFLDWLPSADGIWKSQQAFREYLAWAFYSLTGR